MLLFMGINDCNFLSPDGIIARRYSCYFRDGQPVYFEPLLSIAILNLLKVLTFNHT